MPIFEIYQNINLLTLTSHREHYEIVRGDPCDNIKRFMSWYIPKYKSTDLSFGIFIYSFATIVATHGRGESISKQDYKFVFGISYTNYQK